MKLPVIIRSCALFASFALVTFVSACGGGDGDGGGTAGAGGHARRRRSGRHECGMRARAAVSRGRGGSNTAGRGGTGGSNAAGRGGNGGRGATGGAAATAAATAGARRQRGRRPGRQRRRRPGRQRGRRSRRQRGGGAAGGTGGAATFAQVAQILGTSCGTGTCHDGTDHVDLRNNTGLYGRIVNAMPDGARVMSRVHDAAR